MEPRKEFRGSSSQMREKRGPKSSEGPVQSRKIVRFLHFKILYFENTRVENFSTNKTV